MGDFAGLAARLPYIAALGVDGIWMTRSSPPHSWTSAPTLPGCCVTEDRRQHRILRRRATSGAVRSCFPRGPVIP
ncbi:alpha-amylase family glycosyl hydrolase [Arthrobacter sp. U41]|uniref:alpha-amylase family glycosyl hydrolase n=1 Tax=Arthrobacter sp. U41 TaxID=1849032 RepID=UPI001E4DCA1E|nr:alpha-amylase family glycosyl hydrolase [Arthrobacter sp. U41]